MDNLLWYSDSVLEQIIAVEPATGKVVHKLECPEVRTDLTALGPYLVQVVGETRKLRIIDPDSGKVVEEWANPRPENKLCGLEASDAGIWLGYRDPPVLDLRSPYNLELLDTIPVNREVAGLTVIGRFVLFASHAGSQLSVLDPATKTISSTIAVAGHPTGLTWDGSRVWYCDYSSVQLRAIEVPPVVQK
jgi:glutamine cyclotransferase